MLIMLVRHAQAADRDAEKYPDDTRRPLTRKGKASHARLTRALVKRDIRPDVIVSSPWKRAWQTAEIMAQGYADAGHNVPVRPAESLADAPDLARIAEEVSLGQAKGIALVGHEPWMSELAGLLLTGSPEGMAIDYPKGGVVGIEADDLAPASGSLRFFLRPKMF